jgi:uncharacterized membrane protein
MAKQIFLYVMICFYIIAGANHFANPKLYLRIIPSWLPNPSLINYSSGAFEILFALLLIPQTTRSVAAWLIIALLIAVFPANVQMTLNFWRAHDPKLWLTIIRLPFQLILIWWAWLYTRYP